MDAARADAVRAAHDADASTARERLDALLDAGSLVEYGVLAGSDDWPADGFVGGAGLVDGAPVIASSYDRTVAGGTQSERNARKFAKLVTVAVARRWPFVTVVDSDGARPGDPLPVPPIVVYPRNRWDMLDGLAELSGWAPTVSVVSGRAVDGAAAVAMLTDCTIATRTATIDGASAEDHAKAGHVDVVVDDDAAAMATARRFVSYWTHPDLGDGLPASTHDGLAAVIPDNRRRPYDMRKIVSGFSDEDSVLELGRTWATSMITSLARLGGRTIGIFANQPSSPVAGAIDAAAADKAARFIELCDAYEFPLVSFIDNPGYMVGPQAEREGIARHHARPLLALHHRTVPLYSVQIRKAYGLGPYAMSGFGQSQVTPDLRLAWPSVESGGMSLEGAAFLVKRKEIQAAATPEAARKIRDDYAETMRDAASGLRAGRSYAFDDIVTPTETRAVILAMLQRTPRHLPDAKKHPIDLH